VKPQNTKANPGNSGDNPRAFVVERFSKKVCPGAHETSSEKVVYKPRHNKQHNCQQKKANNTVANGQEYLSKTAWAGT
jgi:hypothetical protein